MLYTNLFLAFGILMVIAFAVKFLSGKLGIPEVTGYVIAGVGIGILLSNFTTHPILEHFDFVSSIALSIIAFTIGIELKWDVIKKLGRPILFITLFESIGAFIVVVLAMLPVYHGSYKEALLLGSVAAATAPAATVAVVRQYKAKGVLTSTILAVVGIDDAVALTIYVVASSFVKAGLTGTNVSFFSVLGSALLSVAVSFAIGVLFAFAYIVLLNRIQSNDHIMLLLFAFLFAVSGLCSQFGVSELLGTMVFGILAVNLSPVIAMKSESIVHSVSPVFTAAFFMLGGAHLDIRLIGQVGLAGAVYFFARSAGKIGGGSLGAVVGRAPETVRKYVGFALLPQVGVALALALSIHKDFATAEFGNEGKYLAALVMNILLLTTIFTEIIGPLMTRAVLRKSGDIAPEEKTPDTV